MAAMTTGLWRAFAAAVTLQALGWAAVQADDVRVAVAANFKPAMDALETAFEAQAPHDLRVTAGATGLLYAQIVQGAPFDVFLAADQARPARLEENGLGVAGSRVTYALGRLIVWDPLGGEVTPERLRSGGDRRLAIAKPALAPYGAAALETLTALGLDEATRARRVEGVSVGQSFAFVHAGAAELGFVALSQVLALPEEARGRWWEPEDLHGPITQDAIILKRADGVEAVEAFMAFLTSDPAGALIERFGYARP